jgi:SAM-dependent methyltransferase
MNDPAARTIPAQEGSEPMNDHLEILAAQRELWGTAPRDWAQLAEPENLPLYERMLDVGGVARGARLGDAGAVDRRTTLLDLGCGSGLLCQLAAQRGAVVAGIDICPQLLEIAGERTPAADLRDGDISALPFPDATFDLITAANAIQFAPDPLQALSEAARVLRPVGLLVVALFAEPERNEGTVLHLAMKNVAERVEGEEDGYAPYALSQPGGLEQAVRVAGLRVREAGELPVAWRYADRDTTLRALLCSAGGARAVKAAGRDRVAGALTQAMSPFVADDGTVTIRNIFRYVAAAPPV